MHQLTVFELPWWNLQAQNTKRMTIIRKAPIVWRKLPSDSWVCIQAWKMQTPITQLTFLTRIFPGLGLITTNLHRMSKKCFLSRLQSMNCIRNSVLWLKLWWELGTGVPSSCSQPNVVCQGGLLPQRSEGAHNALSITKTLDTTSGLSFQAALKWRRVCLLSRNSYSRVITSSPEIPSSSQTNAVGRPVMTREFLLRIDFPTMQPTVTTSMNSQHANSPMRSAKHHHPILVATRLCFCHRRTWQSPLHRPHSNATVRDDHGRRTQWLFDSQSNPWKTGCKNLTTSFDLHQIERKFQPRVSSLFVTPSKRCCQQTQTRNSKSVSAQLPAKTRLTQARQKTNEITLKVAQSMSFSVCFETTTKWSNAHSVILLNASTLIS